MNRAILLATALALSTAPPQVRAQNYIIQAETGMLSGTTVQTQKPGYTGTGYVSFYGDSANSVLVQATVPDGLYELWVRYNSEFGFKGYGYHVDLITGTGGFDGTGANEWKYDRAGAFELTGELNNLRINRGWGWYNVEALELRPYTPPTLQPISNRLVDPLADRPTQMLMNYLVSQYGQKTLSGLQHNSSENLSFPVSIPSANYLGMSGGVVPAIRGSDLIEYSPTRIQNFSTPDNETEQTIAWAKQTGGVVSVMWHWNAPANLINTPCGSNCGPNDRPWWRGFYANATTFNLAAALDNPAGNDYQLILRDIDAIAVQLQKYEDAGVPVIWRPLHEARGGGFWWGAHGSEDYKQLWHVLHDRLTNHHGLHNLIWEFSSLGVNGGDDQWYPGDDVVDIVGLDLYTEPADNMSGGWLDALDVYNGRKMIAVSETDTLVDPDVMDKFGIKWSYAAPWGWDYVLGEYRNAGYNDSQIAAILQDFLIDENVVTLNELPVLPWSNLAPELPGDYNLDGTVNTADYTVWRNSLGEEGTGLAADGNGDGKIDDADFAVWKLYFGVSTGGGGANSVPEPGTGGLLILALSGLLGRRSRSQGVSR